MSLNDMLTQAHSRLPLLKNMEPAQGNLSPFTTPPVQPPTAPPTTAQQAVGMQGTAQADVQPSPFDNFRDRTGDMLKTYLNGYTSADRPGAQPPVQMGTVPTSIGPGIMELAMAPVMGRRGNPKEDVERGINIVAHGIANGANSIPSGGPTGSINYADLPGKYGRLVDPPGGPSDLRLQKGAWQSLHSLGVPADAILGGSYRTNAQQTAYYAKDPQRYAPPGTSLHEYGLAIDMNSAFIDKYANALLSNGWYRERSDEPWHFSFGVFTPAPTAPAHTSRSQPSNPPKDTPKAPRRSQGGSHQQL